MANKLTNNARQAAADDVVRDASQSASRAGSRRGGRPPVDLDKRKSVVVSSRYSPAEYEDIVSRCVKAGIKPSAFQHAAVMDKPLSQTHVVTDNVELIRQIKAVGINLNQLARIANKTGHLPKELARCLDDLNGVLMGLIEK